MFSINNLRYNIANSKMMVCGWTPSDIIDRVHSSLKTDIFPHSKTGKAPT